MEGTRLYTVIFSVYTFKIMPTCGLEISCPGSFISIFGPWGTFPSSFSHEILNAFYFSHLLTYERNVLLSWKSLGLELLVSDPLWKILTHSYDSQDSYWHDFTEKYLFLICSPSPFVCPCQNPKSAAAFESPPTWFEASCLRAPGDHGKVHGSCWGYSAFCCHGCTVISTQQARWKLVQLSAQVAVTPSGCSIDTPSVWGCYATWVLPVIINLQWNIKHWRIQFFWQKEAKVGIWI